MPDIISGYHNTPQILNSGTPSVTITGTIKANGSFAVSNPNYTPLYTAVYGPETGNFTVTNLGTIDETLTTNTTASVAGIFLAAPGTLNNQGSIYGFADGVLAVGGTVSNQDIITSQYDGVFLAAAGLVKNSGTIAVEGTNTSFGDWHGGVRLSYGGSVNNSGLITSNQFGIVGVYDPASITNSGTIEGTGGTFTFRGTLEASSGIVLLEGGLVSNTSAGLISGQDGIVIEGSAGSSGSVSNAGSVIGTLIGVAATAFTSIDNSGLIKATDATLVTFAGAIFEGLGVELTAGGTITNQSTGIISGVEDGVFIVAAPGTITNSGLIKSTGSTFVVGGSTYGADGVLFSDAGGTVINQLGGTIIGYAVGVQNAVGSTLGITVDNSGLIEGTAPIFFGNALHLGRSSGVALNSGGTLINRASGRLSGYLGAYAGGGVGSVASTVENFGSINGFGNFGVVLGNSAGLSNSGEITGETIGIYGFAGNSFTNLSGGIISGGEAGIVATDTVGLASAIFNSGSISGSGVGVFLNAGGKVTNSSGGVISGFYGVDATDSASSTLTVSNDGNISGTLDGIKLTGGREDITNSGTIDATGGTFTINGTVEIATGIDLLARGTVTNASGGLVTGKYGIEIDGGTSASAVITNEGSIIGTYFGLNINAPATITNIGFIEATSDQRFENISGGSFGGAGINLNAGGTIVNQVGGTIIGYNGINTNNISASIINLGYITGENAYSAIYLNTFGEVTNYGTIHDQAMFNGAANGADAVGAPLGGIVSNASAGLMDGGAGVYFKTTGTFTNSGRVTVESSAFSALGLATLTNTGLMESTSPTNVFAGHTYISAGANLTGGGVITNAGGTILSSDAGIISYGAPPSIFNSGTIEATGIAPVSVQNPTAGTLTLAPAGIALLEGGSVTNTSAGLISGVDGILLEGSFGSAAVITNAGSIIGVDVGVGATVFTSIENSGLIEATDTTLVTLSGFTFAGLGVDLLDGGSVTNVSGGTIIGQELGILTESSLGFATTIDNSGLIEALGTQFVTGGETIDPGGISMLDGGTLTNEATGNILGFDGVFLTNGTAGIASYLENLGTITGSSLTGVVLGVDARMSNSGHISGARYGVIVLDGDTITNQSGGFISGGNLGVDFAEGGTLTNAGTITGTGGAAVYFGTSSSGEAIIDPGAVFNGTVFDAANNGVLDLAAAATHGTLSGIGSEFIGFSQISIDAGADWTLTGANSIGTGQTLSDYGTLVVDGAFTNNGLVETDPSTITFTGDLSGTGEITVGTDSVIVFDGSVSSGETIVFADTTGTIFINDPAGFQGAITGANGTVIMACFAAGTHILTPRGDVAVEDLAVGDLVITHDGEDAPIKWIGRRMLDLTRHPQPEKAQPIRIAAGALDENTPSRDLLLSPDHALYLKNHLVPVKALRNFSNITQLNRRSVTYYHIELENHSVIFAEATPVETYLETGNRHAFENDGVAVMLHPDFARTDYQAMREAEGCAPFAEHGPVVDGIRRSILQRVYAYRTG